VDARPPIAGRGRRRPARPRASSASLTHPASAAKHSCRRRAAAHWQPAARAASAHPPVAPAPSPIPFVLPARMCARGNRLQRVGATAAAGRRDVGCAVSGLPWPGCTAVVYRTLDAAGGGDRSGFAS
jgi:hypothetical protein